MKIFSNLFVIIVFFVFLQREKLEKRKEYPMKRIKSLIVIALASISVHAFAQTSTPWLLDGNAIPSATPPTTTVFGTTTNNPIEIRTANLLRMYIDNSVENKTSGYIGVNTNTPRQMFHVVGGNILISRTAESSKALGSTNGSILFGDETSAIYPYGSWGIEYVNNSTEGYGLNFWKTWDENGGERNNVVFLCEEQDYKGYVGIGTNHPKQKLHVIDGNILISRSSTSSSAPGSACGSMMFGNVVGDGHPLSKWAIGYCYDNEKGGLNFWRPYNDQTGVLNYAIYIEDKDGNVGINTNCPRSKLSVNGTVRAKEVIVTLEGWCDHVFLPDYKLTGLYELESYVNEYHHLPGVPTENDVLEDGAHLGEMNAILLQKVEELTLYVIELQKQIDELKRQNEERE